MLPWTDRTGTVSPVKIAALFLLALPAAWLAIQAGFGLLGGRPLTEAIHQSGEWAIRFLMLALFVTPARHVFGTTRLIPARRLIGLGALAYALLHLGLYAASQQFVLWKVASEIALRFYLTLGFVALVILAVLGSTSFDSAIRRLGAERWRWLHLLVFPATILALIHEFLQSRLDVTQAVAMTGLFLALVIMRVLIARRIALDAKGLALTAIFAVPATVAVETAWFALVRRVPAEAILWAQIDPDLGVRPAWIVGLSLIALMAVQAMLRFMPGRGPAARSARVSRA